MSTTGPRTPFGNDDEVISGGRRDVLNTREAPLAAAALALVLTLLGCAGTDDNQTSAPNAVPSEQESTSPAPSLEGTPFAALAAGTQPAPGFWPPLTFTAPDGWLTEPAADGLLSLMPDTAENRERIQAGGPPVMFLNVFPNISAAAEDCGEAAAPGVGPAASDIVGALATRPGLSTGGPAAVTIGGLSGQQIDVSIASDWTGNCSGGGPFVPLVYSPGFIWWGAEPGEQFRIIVLDVAGLPSGMYATVMIVIYSAEAAAWDDHLSSSTEVVETFEFDTSPPGP